MVEMIEEPKCATCPMCLKAEEKPKSLMAQISRWHTTWCPGWKSYQTNRIKTGVIPHNQLPAVLDKLNPKNRTQK